MGVRMWIFRGGDIKRKRIKFSINIIVTVDKFSNLEGLVKYLHKELVILLNTTFQGKGVDDYHILLDEWRIEKKVEDIE